MSRALLVFAFLAATALASGANEQLEISIQKVDRSAGEVSFHIVIRNSGVEPLFLEASTKGTRELHAVSIEKARGANHWKYLAPHRDLPADHVFPLLPHQQMEARITLADPYPDYTGRDVPIVGRFRATVRYFRSREAWENRMKLPLQHIEEAESVPVTVPRGAGQERSR